MCLHECGVVVTCAWLCGRLRTNLRIKEVGKRDGLRRRGVISVCEHTTLAATITNVPCPWPTERLYSQLSLDPGGASWLILSVECEQQWGAPYTSRQLRASELSPCSFFPHLLDDVKQALALEERNSSTTGATLMPGLYGREPDLPSHTGLEQKIICLHPDVWGLFVTV